MPGNFPARAMANIIRDEAVTIGMNAPNEAVIAVSDTRIFQGPQTRAAMGEIPFWIEETETSAGVQEMCDLTRRAFQLAFQYRTPVIVLADAVQGQMMETLTMPEHELDESIDAAPHAAE